MSCTRLVPFADYNETNCIFKTKRTVSADNQHLNWKLNAPLILIHSIMNCWARWEWRRDDFFSCTLSIPSGKKAKSKIYQAFESRMCAICADDMFTNRLSIIYSGKFHSQSSIVKLGLFANWLSTSLSIWLNWLSI